ncbi:FAD-dependent oxidoreductase [Nocardioides sp. GY 10127]|uniref:FAD-dependent oxidoreductase n=1 Tax=Nocardioides sp. GY 10127 TaxID=2569762 RepID=UPI0010A821DF|nr:FAD-dependent oxidoreductase [Nocardioides sp. GY 10127]TIC80052.1 FAD-dependent oxidoreductase [Nocardioides sp. GY 10127]
MPYSRTAPDVVIVGAGPTGLILAHELLRRGVAVRLLEKRRGPSHTTRAMTVHARSMEMFDHMGVARRLEEVCTECPGNIYHFPGRTLDEQPRTDYRDLPTRYAFYYKINQNDFEQVLREHLLAAYSVVPEYRTEVLDVVDEGTGVRVDLLTPDGEPETVRAAWVVGCDGKRSLVRDRAGIDFVGEEVAAMAMMDVQLTNVTFDDLWMNYFFDETLFMNCTKLPGRNWRIYMADATGDYVHMADKRASFQEVADKLGIGFQVGEPEWATEWPILNNIATSYRTGRLVICGDASHIHSPSGGQGMNGCMQDAFNLGWKLAAVVQGQAEEAVLDTYEAERRPIGELVTEGAMSTHEIVMGFGIPPEDRYHLTQEEGWEENSVRLVSGLSHHYRENVRVPEGLGLLSGPRPGERAPDALLVEEPRKRLYDVCRHPGFTVVAVTGEGQDEAATHAAAAEVRDLLAERHPGRASVHLVTDGGDETGFDFDHRSGDEHGELAERYEVGSISRLVVIRPDLYVGMACSLTEARLVLDYLDQWFVPAAVAVTARETVLA